MVIKDIEREDIEFVCKTLGCRPIASLDHFTAENLVNVDLVEEVNEPAGKYIKVSIFLFFIFYGSANGKQSAAYEHLKHQRVVGESGFGKIGKGGMKLLNNSKSVSGNKLIFVDEWMLCGWAHRISACARI